MVDLVEDGPLEMEIGGNASVFGLPSFLSARFKERVQALTGSSAVRSLIWECAIVAGMTSFCVVFYAGQQFKFDILMDIGGFRDMHRHRRCTQIEQGFTRHHGYDTPPDISEAGLQGRYSSAMQKVVHQCEKFATGKLHAALYLLPMAFRKRTLFKMDFAEALYISELRSGPAGHFSYRNVAYAMYEEVARKHPSLAKYFRVTDVKEPFDLLKR